MKRFLLCLITVPFLGLFTKTVAQSCNISDVAISNTNVIDANGSDGICRATFDASFTIANNSNNNFIFIQTYVSSATQGGVPVDITPYLNPNHFGCSGGGVSQTAPPTTLAQVGNPLLNIVIDNSATTPALSATYVLNSGIGVKGVVSGSSITREVLPNGDLRFTLTGLQLDMPFECSTGTEYTFVSNVFTTAAANSTTVNCVNCGVITPVPSLQISGSTNCNVTSASFFNFSSNSMSVNYSIYADINGDGKLLATTDGGTDVLVTSGNIPLAAGATQSVTANLTGTAQGKDVIVAVNLGAGQLAEVLPTVECTTPLPVSFKSFSAKRNNSNVVLTWETASESNNKGFSVQRNTGEGWKEITFVGSKGNGGNSSSILGYNFTDNNTEKGITQYRLLQVDHDGKSEASEIRSVKGIGQLSKAMIYPNPSKDGSVNIVFDEDRGNKDVLISDMGGRVIKQYRNVVTSTMRIDQLNAGMYSVRIVNQATGTQTIEKLVINR